MPEVLDDLVHLPLGSHCISFHVSRTEAADHAVSFLDGTPDGQAARYWVTDEERRAQYAERLSAESADHVGSVAVLPTEQVERSDGKLRPVPTVLDFVGAHPEGVTAAGETLSHYWTPETIPEHLEYEAWFDGQRRDGSRFLCPYDLRRLPPEDGPEVMRSLGAHHSHVILSDSPEAAVRLLQLFVFGTVGSVPDALRHTLQWAVSRGWVEVSDELKLTPTGEAIVREWSQTATIEW